MIIHQIKFSLINLGDKDYERKAYEVEQFQNALAEGIDGAKPITAVVLDDVEITGGYDSIVKVVAMELDKETKIGKLVIEFTDGTTGAVGFDETDMVTAYIHDEKLHIDVMPAVPIFGE
jgi:hypothetical protein